jgi:acyl-CoA reductase-like NAD-dependent aldehyde dehydrogenase
LAKRREVILGYAKLLEQNRDEIIDLLIEETGKPIDNAEYDFDLRKIAPGVRYRRLRGSSQQDPTTNNGRPVGDTVTLAPRDGLFLVRIKPGE